MTERLPPHSLDAERSVLGSILIRPAALHDVAAVIASPDDFFLPAHREIFGVVVELSKSGDPIDAITVSNALGAKLDRMEGGIGYLLELTGAVPTAENARHYAKVVRGKATLRRIISACAEAQSRAYGDADEGEVLSDLRASLASVELADEGGPVRLGEILEDVLDVIEKRATAPEKYGVTSGLGKFDEKIGNFKEGQQIVIAARPGGGKSAHAWSTAIRATMAGVPALAFSLEMSKQQLGERAFALTASVPGFHLSRGRVDYGDWGRIRDARKVLGPLPLWLDDRKLTCARICAEARRWRAKYAPDGLALLVIDYIGLVRSGERSENRAQEVAGMSRTFKLLAGELKCPLLLVSQLNRESAKLGPRKPMLSDLRDSGAIEQDADMVIFPWRENETEQGGPSHGPEAATLIVAKNREGPTGEVDVEWDGRYMAFFDQESGRPETRFADA